jgi:hypothetical protein
MPTEWETIVSLARELDGIMAAGEVADPARVALLARKVLAFQRNLTTMAAQCAPKRDAAPPLRKTA